eukprot:g1217.t1
MNRFIAGWASRAKLLQLRNLVLATLDSTAYELCLQHHGLCVRGQVSLRNKYTLLLVALQLGFDVMWLDFDIFLVRHPTKALQQASQGYDLLMGYDLESDCLCNGFFFIRANEKTHAWLFEMLRWLYNHPYEHDQRAISAFLNYTERISLKLILVHFVDGSAFSLYGRPSWDPSIPAEKRLGDDQPAPSTMEAFYQPEMAELPPEQLETSYLGQLLKAKVKKKPESFGLTGTRK